MRRSSVNDQPLYSVTASLIYFTCICMLKLKWALILTHWLDPARWWGQTTGIIMTIFTTSKPPDCAAGKTAWSDRPHRDGRWKAQHPLTPQHEITAAPWHMENTHSCLDGVLKPSVGTTSYLHTAVKGFEMCYCLRRSSVWRVCFWIWDWLRIKAVITDKTTEEEMPSRLKKRRSAQLFQGQVYASLHLVSRHQK